MSGRIFARWSSGSRRSQRGSATASRVPSSTTGRKSGTARSGPRCRCRSGLCRRRPPSILSRRRVRGRASLEPVPEVPALRPLVWFRRDLRTKDNTALFEASRAATRGMVAAFVVCAEDWRRHDDAPVKVDLWLRTLRELSCALAALNIPLIILESRTPGRIGTVLLELADRAECDALFFNEEYEVDERARDESVTRKFESSSRCVRSFHDHVVFDPASIRTGEGRFYSVFTPFKRAFLARAETEGIRLLPPPKRQPEMVLAPTPVPERIEGFQTRIDPTPWPAGERHAIRRLEQFCERGIAGYKDGRDFPALDTTSRLSPYLNSGTLSPRQCIVAARGANQARLDDSHPGAPGPATWISEVIWREFYQHVLVGFPRVSMGRAFRPATDRIGWSDRLDHFESWCGGRTGVPVVDAAMRQLNTTGWMHNRLRMIAAMYLTKDLFIDWRLGERYFMQRLIDGDLGSNNGGWQWSASTGTDAAPYFRIFNPITQSRRFDPNGDFIRAWLPELRGVEGDAVHDPSVLPPLRRAALDYPQPLVDRDAVKERVIAAFKAIG
ncbi:MAG: deoxyribodipyrimidine photo-lyase [Phycisphaerae bacterium]|nr:deoxyribodipyrimidine photo-lyase [Phycisphaerae bacterium]